MPVLPRVEQILRQLGLAGEQPEAPFSRDRRPEACPSADAAVAAIGALAEIEVGFESDGATVATAMVGLQHGGLGNEVWFTCTRRRECPVF
jgi:hypothetical protein